MNKINLSMLASVEAYDHCLRIALRAGQLGVWDWNIPEDRIEWSDKVYEIHGMQRGEFGGTMADYRALIHPDDLERVSAAIERTMTAGEEFCTEFRIVRPGRHGEPGEARWVASTAELLLDERGNPWRLTGASIDITSRRSSDEAIKRINQELEQFAFSASHELQEPLRTVSNFAQLLTREVKGRVGNNADDYLEFIMDGTRRMRALIDGLLALSRTSVTVTHPLPAVDAGKILEVCVRLLDGAIAESGAVIEHEPLPRVNGDEAQLAQLFQNLLSNAIKYRKPGQRPEIKISAAPRSGGQWQFCVHDNGLGFDPAQAHVLFTPFRRLHGRDIPGTGIGLALCRRIVERHGGKIWAEAAPGKGAAFCFTLPGAVV